MNLSNRRTASAHLGHPLPRRRITGAGDASDSRWWIELLRLNDVSRCFEPDDNRGERSRSCQSLQW